MLIPSHLNVGHFLSPYCCQSFLFFLPLSFQSFFFLKTWSHSIALIGWNALSRPGWPWTQIVSLAPASWVLELPSVSANSGPFSWSSPLLSLPTVGSVGLQEGCSWHCSRGDAHKCLLTPGRKRMTKQSEVVAKVHLDEQTSFIVVLYRNVGESYLQEQK